jgi:hypothetical protein
VGKHATERGARFDTFAYGQPSWAHTLPIFGVDHPATQQSPTDDCPFQKFRRERNLSRSYVYQSEDNVDIGDQARRRFRRGGGSVAADSSWRSIIPVASMALRVARQG